MTRKPTAKRASTTTTARKTTQRAVTRKVASKAASKTSNKPARPAAEKTKVDKPKKTKLVRDSFTMPEQEYALLAQLKKTCLAAGLEIKKSELLRIGVAQLAGMDVRKIKAAQAALIPVKTGRPKKHK